MRCYRIIWNDIYGRDRCYLVIALNDVSAENELRKLFKDFSFIVSTEYLPFDRIIEVKPRHE